MNTSFSKIALVFGAGLLAAACGGNVVVDSGTGNGGAGGTTTITDPCKHYADALVAKYAECGIEVNVGGSGGAAACTPTNAALATCLEDCLPTVDCACTVDPTGPDCATKQKPYVDCVTNCVN
jgi:hypothetical protein